MALRRTACLGPTQERVKLKKKKGREKEREELKQKRTSMRYLVRGFISREGLLGPWRQITVGFIYHVDEVS